MTLSNRATACVAFCFAVNLFSAMAFGEIMDYGTSYTDSLGVTWSGTSHFEHPTSGLKGDIDWIVYGPGQFPYGDSGYAPPSDQFTYAYQIDNTGTVAISDFTVSVNQTVANVDAFISLGRVEGVLPVDTDFVLGPGGWVKWIYTTNGINPENSSAGLVFTSLKAPMFSTGRVTDGGSSVGGISLPGPGPNDIPEPSMLMLLLSGIGLIAIAGRFSRR